MAKAKWSMRPADLRPQVGSDGTVTLSAPLLDSNKVVGRLVFTMTSNRALRVEWLAEPGAAPLTDFQAWMKQEGI